MGIALGFGMPAGGQTSSSSSKASPSKMDSKKQADAAASAKGEIDPGIITNGVYRNKALGLSCKIPDGWVLRTDEMNARAGEKEKAGSETATSAGGKVLLAAFSRPPEARAEDVNASLLIAVESQAAYPGLKEAAQYFQPLTEVANAQGFTADEDPYDIAVGSKVLVRGDFHKDVGSRVMRQSTLAFLVKGYAVSITVIGGTDDEVEDLVDGLSFDGDSKHR
jgi:hypothetical protein